jgi:hypothetical protein
MLGSVYGPDLHGSAVGNADPNAGPAGENDPHNIKREETFEVLDVILL